jgi:hypothetical protein
MLSRLTRLKLTVTAQEYRISHPFAQVNGILKGTFYGTISDQISLTSLGKAGETKLRALVDYKDEVRESACIVSHALILVVVDREAAIPPRRRDLPVYRWRCGSGGLAQAETSPRGQSCRQYRGQLDEGGSVSNERRQGVFTLPYRRDLADPQVGIADTPPPRPARSHPEIRQTPLGARSTGIQTTMGSSHSTARCETLAERDDPEASC